MSDKKRPETVRAEGMAFSVTYDCTEGHTKAMLHCKPKGKATAEQIASEAFDAVYRVHAHERVGHGMNHTFSAVLQYNGAEVAVPVMYIDPDGRQLEQATARIKAALEALGKPTAKPVVGAHTARAAGMEAQRQAALNDPSEGI